MIKGLRIWGGLLLVSLLLFSCEAAEEEHSESTVSDTAEMVSTDTNLTEDREGTYMHITAEEAKTLMDTESECIILDVRTAEEFAAGHIPGALLIPDSEITAQAEDKLPDKDQLILVYCRSGRRSKNAAQALADLGYTNIKEFGGILDWPYETEIP